MTANDLPWVDVAAEDDLFDDLMLPCQVSGLQLFLVV